MEFNAIRHTIWGLPGYGFFTGVGFVVSTCVFIVLLSRKHFPVEVDLRILFASFIFLLLFARGFGILSALFRYVAERKPLSWEILSEGGIVFFGGLIGLLLAFHIISRAKKTDKDTIHVLAVCIPLFHAFARVGCFFGGCCFGKESTCILSIEYTTLIDGVTVTAQRIPIQLFEAVFNLSLFLYLLFLIARPNWRERLLLHQYLFFYSFGRFILEFYRGDSVRGVAFGISFSQIICMIVLLLEIARFVTIKKRKTKREEFGL